MHGAQGGALPGEPYAIARPPREASLPPAPLPLGAGGPRCPLHAHSCPPPAPSGRRASEASAAQASENAAAPLAPRPRSAPRPGRLRC